MKKKILRFLLILVLSGVSFFLLTKPFHKLFSVFTVTEVRPSAVLYPLLGISFGLPSALGIMIANFISDAANGYSAAILLEGLPLQLLYVMVPYFVWKYLTKGEDHIHRLDGIARVLKFVLICAVFAFLSGCGVGMIVHINFGAGFWASGAFVFLNNFVISVILGCPLMIVFNQVISRRAGTDRTLTLEEKIIIFSAIVQAVGLAVLIPLFYAGGILISTYDIWNSIYLYTVCFLLIVMVLTLGIMIMLEKERTKKKA